MSKAMKRLSALFMVFAFALAVFAAGGCDSDDDDYSSSSSSSSGTLASTDFDTIESLDIDYTQAAQLPLTGYYTKSFEDGRSVAVYIAEEASIRTYMTVIAVPDGVDTQEFLQDEGWIDVADEKGEAIFVLEPGEDGWGTLDEESDYMDEAMSFLGSGTNDNGVTVFSYLWLYYAVGYGEGAPILEAWTAENPISVIGQVFVDGTGLDSETLAEIGDVEYDHTNTSGYGELEEDDFDATLERLGKSRICRKDVVLPTWFVNYDEDDTSIDYWKTANDCLDTAVDGVYYQDINSDAFQTEFATIQILDEDPDAQYGLSQVKVSEGDVTAADIYEFLSYWSRYDNSFAYSNALARRIDFTAARVEAQQLALDATATTLSDGNTQFIAMADEEIDGHGTVIYGVFAFSDISGDGEYDPRDYVIYVPDGYDGKELPVAIMYPGNLQTPVVAFDSSQWYHVADMNGVVVAFVGEGYGSAVSVTHVDSDLYYDAIMTVLKDKIDGTYADLDFTRVYGTGHSLGSMTVQGFARTNPEFFAAVGSTSGVDLSDPDEVVANEPIPDFLITGQADITNDEGKELMPNVFESEDLQSWALYLFGVDGLEYTEVNEDDAVYAFEEPRTDTYSWNDEDGITVVKWGQTLLRAHNAHPSDVAHIWEFLKHFSYEEDADGNIVRYYSESAFEEDDAQVILDVEEEETEEEEDEDAA